MSKILYSALIGDFDPLMGIHIPPTKNWKFIMYTDSDIDRSKLTPEQNRWEFRKADMSKGRSPRHVNRWYKLHPHLLFPDFDHSLYIDSKIAVNIINIVINSGFQKILLVLLFEM
ncbi:hypothetical protein TetV_021 [Tetraselmis virus 1]|uniref:Uncharacterized protein n=1 Tax=Tetraselmis virus 1 TaxID=2060617 RepID=A0A2P0VMK6_9VIRU|nr:hypothetical protein QJ968_gp021 [Tetraselmis virus 1]AUF82113.1 hypothetical protein TetV_021 [Tetraselmis virus 1]